MNTKTAYQFGYDAFKRGITESSADTEFLAAYGYSATRDVEDVEEDMQQWCDGFDDAGKHERDKYTIFAKNMAPKVAARTGASENDVYTWMIFGESMLGATISELTEQYVSYTSERFENYPVY